MSPTIATPSASRHGGGALPTCERCPDLAAVEERAHAFAVARYGRLPVEMSESRAREYLARGWGLRVSKERAADAIGSGGWKHAASRTIGVGYQLAAGRSSGGFDRGVMAVKYSAYTVESIEAWARTVLIYES